MRVELEQKFGEHENWPSWIWRNPKHWINWEILRMEFENEFPNQFQNYLENIIVNWNNEWNIIGLNFNTKQFDT
jgi:hypothetical protein